MSVRDIYYKKSCREREGQEIQQEQRQARVYMAKNSPCNNTLTNKLGTTPKEMSIVRRGGASIS